MRRTVAQVGFWRKGQANIPLTEKDREQAVWLADEPLDAAYASDLARAWDTMTIALAGRDVARYTEPHLREQSKGVRTSTPRGRPTTMSPHPAASR